MAHLELAALLVRDYQPAIDFFVGALDFDLVTDEPALTTDGRPKRWVVVRPKGGATGLVLARAEGDAQQALVGAQCAGRVGFFLRVDDFAAAYARMQAHQVAFVELPRMEPYGTVAVFRDCEGNRWDLLGPAAPPQPRHAGGVGDAASGGGGGGHVQRAHPEVVSPG
jgi:catechol 2,3-dioxygenase-like lactoylglutathione lyase family enzyme